MHHIFIDTDIILDFLGDRKPFAKYAVEIFKKADRREIILHTSGNSITTSYYLLCKFTSEKKARSLVYGIMEYVNVIPVTDKILKLAIKSEFKDFEDAVQHFCALTVETIEFIITRNINNYKKSQIPVIGPEQPEPTISMKKVQALTPGFSPGTGTNHTHEKSPGTNPGLQPGDRNHTHAGKLEKFP